MSKAVAIALASVLLFAAAPSKAWSGHGHGNFGHSNFHGSHGTRVVVGFGPTFWWGPGFWWGPPYAYAPPVVVLNPPPVYVAPAPAPANGFWYYCQSAGAYYPNVATCPEPWVQVLPRSG